VVHHGAEARWLTEDRRAIRARLGLSPEWQTSVLLTSFGHVQEHKRIEPLLNAFAHARRERPDLRLSLIGAEHRDSFDARRPVRELGLEPYVLFTGRVREEEAWPWIHAGDFAVQLRGPSTGGTSGGVFQSLGLGRAVIASDLDEQRELPETLRGAGPAGGGRGGAPGAADPRPGRGRGPTRAHGGGGAGFREPRVQLDRRGRALRRMPGRLPAAEGRALLRAGPARLVAR
jgi:hypothetical protein